MPLPVRAQKGDPSRMTIPQAANGVQAAPSTAGRVTFVGDRCACLSDGTPCFAHLEQLQRCGV